MPKEPKEETPKETPKENQKENPKEETPKEIIENAEIKELKDRLANVEGGQSKVLEILNSLIPKEKETPEEKESWIKTALKELNEAWGIDS